ncbi:hypothetical protein JYQ62_19410 [Nostoc sp. UHCC 0702]|nr:hypothetical protein JYQ62_19410 [Nostoc sp. UHCC 0702]
MPPTPGYFETKSQIKARTSSQRANNYSRSSLDDDGNPCWYMFLAASTSSVDDDSVLMPYDNPLNGRWHKYGGVGGSGSSSLPGFVTCTSNCYPEYRAGKVFEFFTAHTNLILTIEVGFDIATQIPANSEAIAIYRWSGPPDTSLSYKEDNPIATFLKMEEASVSMWTVLIVDSQLLQRISTKMNFLMDVACNGLVATVSHW